MRLSQKRRKQMAKKIKFRCIRCGEKFELEYIKTKIRLDTSTATPTAKTPCPKCGEECAAKI